MRTLLILGVIAVLAAPARADLRDELKEAKKTVRALEKEQPVGYEETLDALVSELSTRVEGELRVAGFAVDLTPDPGTKPSKAIDKASAQFERAGLATTRKKRLKHLKKTLGAVRKAFKAVRKRSPALADALATPVGTIGDARIDESSGLAFWRGAFWTINDSGVPVLYRSETPDFAVAKAFVVPGASIVDWEDLAVHEGDLVIADTGDNDRVRDRGVLYRVRFDGDDLTLAATYEISYPDGKHDAEALASIDGTLHLITKDRGDGTQVFRFDTLEEGTVNVPTLAATLDLGGDQATAAEYDADRGELILLSYLGVRFYHPTDWTAGPDLTVPIFGLQVEGLALAGDLIAITNEQEQVFAAVRP